MRGGWRKRGLGIVICAGGLFCAVCLGRQNNPGRAKPDGGFKIAGVVVSATTGTPLGQARIILLNTKHRRENFTMITQDNGRFEFTGVTAGKYSLEGAKRGYIPAAYLQHEQYSTAIVTGEGLDTQNLTLRLMPLAALMGTVSDENGEGVRGAQVKLYVESHRGGTTRVVSASSEGTDDRGTFEFAPLGPGKYYVAVSAAPWYAVHPPPIANSSGDNPPVDVDSTLDVTYPTTFSGDSTESEGAEPIIVKAGEHARIEVHLSPVPALHLSFQVAGNGEHGFRMPAIQKRVFDSLEYVPVQGYQAAGPGIFEISGLAPGRYSVQLPGNGSTETGQTTEIELNQDGQNLDEQPGVPAGSVKLSVKVSQGDVPPTQTSIGLQDGQNKTVAFSQVDANGNATFQSLSAGRYTIRVFASAKAYSVVRMSSKDSQIYGHEFTLTPGESQEWSVLLAEGKTNIEGFVKRGSKAAPGVMVVLIPREPEAHQDMFRRDQSDSDGSFVLPDVIPWTYSVVAIENAWGFDWSQPALLAHYSEHGQAITIGEWMHGAVSLSDPVEVQPR